MDSGRRLVTRLDAAMATRPDLGRRELSEASAISTSTFNNWFSSPESANPTVAALSRLAKALDVSTGYFLEVDGARELVDRLLNQLVALGVMLDPMLLTGLSDEDAIRELASLREYILGKTKLFIPTGAGRMSARVRAGTDEPQDRRMLEEQRQSMRQHYADRLGVDNVVETPPGYDEVEEARHVHLNAERAQLAANPDSVIEDGLPGLRNKSLSESLRAGRDRDSDA